MRTGYVKLFLDHGNCTVHCIGQKPASEDRPNGFFWGEVLTGFTEKNIMLLVEKLTRDGFHVTLYRVGQPEFYIQEAQ